MTTTPVLALPELASGQAIPETTVNEQVRILEQGARWFVFLDRDLTAPPGSPNDGEAYLVAASATGAWSGHDGEIAWRMSTAWEFIVPSEGMAGYVADEDVAVAFDGAAWDTIGGTAYTDADARAAVATGETVYVMAAINSLSNAGAANIMELLDGSDQPWLAVRNTAALTAGLFYNSGTGGSPTWTQIGSSFAYTAAVHYFVLKLTLGSPHSAELIYDTVSQASGTFTQASLTSIEAVGFRHPSVNAYVSEVGASVGFNLVGGHVLNGKPGGAGSNSAWTGAYTAIDDLGVGDGDFITSATAAQRSTFAYANSPADGLTAGDFFMWTRCRTDGVAPTNVKPVRRAGGTDTVGSSFSSVGAGFTEKLIRYTGLTKSDYDNSEFGVESAT